MLLLDTHAWLWVFEHDPRRLGRRAKQLVARADVRAAVRVSVVSIFEVAVLHAADRVRVTRPLEQWVREALDQSGVRLAELTPTIAIDAGAIPRTLLPDSFDRLIVATARQLDATLLTADARILDYASQTRSVRIHDAAT